MDPVSLGRKRDILSKVANKTDVRMDSLSAAIQTKDDSTPIPQSPKNSRANKPLRCSQEHHAAVQGHEQHSKEAQINGDHAWQEQHG